MHDHIDTDNLARTIRARQRVEEHYLAVERHTGTPSEGTPDEHYLEALMQAAKSGGNRRVRRALARDDARRTRRQR